MSWRWFKSFKLPFGVNANLSQNGLGWSWGFGFFRWGVSPSGRKWISIGFPGTGFRLFRYVDQFPFEALIKSFKNKKGIGDNGTKSPESKIKPNSRISSNEISSIDQTPQFKKYPKLRVKKK